MGFNTIAVLNQNHQDKWPSEMHDAILRGADKTPSEEKPRFSFGHVLARVEEGSSVIVHAKGNTGDDISVTLAAARQKKPEQPILKNLRTILNGHGYTVRIPGRQRGEGPLIWGFEEELRHGRQQMPETNPVIRGDGSGVAVILLNDLYPRWPEEIVDAMNGHINKRTTSDFGYGRVLSVAHADHLQVAGIHGASGQELCADRFVDPEFLEYASTILRQHGYATRAPGQKTYAEPLLNEG